VAIVAGVLLDHMEQHFAHRPPGVTVDQAGTIAVKVAEPSVAQRLLYLVVVLPGLALVALIAWRMAEPLRAALDSDQFTTHTSEPSPPWPRSPQSAGSPCGR
jgi:hypothetical protein